MIRPFRPNKPNVVKPRQQQINEMLGINAKGPVWVAGYVGNVPPQNVTPQPPVSPTPSPTPGLSPTPTPSVTATSTITPTPTSSETPTPTPTNTVTPTSSETPTPTPTQTPTPSSVSYILDTYSVNEAYSVTRQLKSTAPYAIRVRRSSDNTEQDIGFVNGNLDTSSLLSFVGDGSGYVGVIWDQSGNNQHFTQSNLVEQPLIVSGGTLLTHNGLPYVRFNGTSQRMLGSTTLTNSNDIYAYNVGSASTYSHNLSVVSLGVINASFWGLICGPSRTYITVLNPTGSATVDATGTGFGITKNIHTGLLTSSAVLKVVRNGVETTFNYTGGATRTRRGGGSLGTAYQPLGYFQEFIISSNNTGESAIHNNQRTYYGYY